MTKPEGKIHLEELFDIILLAYGDDIQCGEDVNHFCMSIALGMKFAMDIYENYVLRESEE